MVTYLLQRKNTKEFILAENLIDSFIEIINSHGIAYCHWKSNIHLSQALSGDTDLDLLVERKSFPQVEQSLIGLGFKEATQIEGPRTPGIYHYYGLDLPTGKLVHVHIFTSVLTGESFLKSHMLPFEEMLLRNVDAIENIKVVSKSAELVLFIVRTYIKYGSLLDIIYLQKDPDMVRDELEWLQSGGDYSESLRLLNKYCPVIDDELFLQCIDAIKNNQSLFKKYRLARKVRRQLRIYRRYSVMSRLYHYTSILWEKLWRQAQGSKKNKMLVSGGAVIAFVGPEATGKSTLVSESKSWLGSAFAVRKVHVGKPPSSWITKPINLVLPLMRTVLPRLRTSRIEGHVPADTETLKRSPGGGNGMTALIYAIRSVTLAWDRRKLLGRVKHSAANGELVICDRYPSEEVGVMDSRRLQKKTDQAGGFNVVFNALARLEEYLYRQAPPPDIVLRLSVSVETAKERNRERIKPGKESDQYLESRHRSIGNWRRAGTQYIFDINTEQTLEQTILNVKKAIWETL